MEDLLFSHRAGEKCFPRESRSGSRSPLQRGHSATPRRSGHRAAGRTISTLADSGRILLAPALCMAPPAVGVEFRLSEILFGEIGFFDGMNELSKM